METGAQDKYVRIDPRFCLRGWLGRPYALLDTLTAIAHFVPKGVFDTLQLCNGRFRPSDAIFLGPRQTYLQKLDGEGVLAFSDEPESLEPRQEYRCYPNHYMRQVQWSMTGKCNYRCRHCFMSAPRGLLPQPSTEECLTIADQMAECGVQTVKLTGGECLIRPDFLQIVDRLLEGGVQIETILTNGALVTDELLCALEERDARCGFDISFDGTDGWHDWLRGVEGAEKAAIRAFELCREHGFPTGAQVVLHRDSAPVLRKTINLLGELGVGSVVAGAINCEGEALGISELIMDFDEQFDMCCEYLPQFLEDGAPVRHLTLGGIFEIVGGVPRLSQGRLDAGDACAKKPACAKLRTSMYIGPDGYILPCSTMSHDGPLQARFPNIANTTLAEALGDSGYYDFVCTTVGDVLEKNPECRACSYRGRCLGGCRARGIDDGGRTDPMGIDRNACTFFKGGYFERAKKVIEGLGFSA